MEHILFDDIKKQIETGFINQGWVMVFSFGHNFKNVEQGGLYSALVSSDKVKDSLQNYSWELRYGNGRPGFVSHYKDKQEITEYYRFSDKGFEPLIYYREEFGQYDNYLELSEEFRLYHNLYENFTSHEKKEYIYSDDNGDKEVVAKIGKNEAFIKLKFLKDYISARQMHCLIYFDFMRFSKKTLTELNIEKVNKNFSSDKYFYNHLITDISDRNIRDDKTQSWIMGKSLIENIKDYKPNIWGTIEERDNYSEYIIGYDDNGNEEYFTCDDEKLGNYFGKNPDAPLYVTPVFFRKEVLKKYYDNPTKYSVNDGHISCHSIWSLRLDNNNKDYVIVLLGDLGKLHYKEQLYWKSYNIPPKEEGFSYTAYKRFFAGEPSNPESPDLLLTMRFVQFNESWVKKYGWYLFKPLSQEDNHYFKSLHLLTSSDNEKEFDEQILALTKVFIDSLNEKEIIKGIEIAKENPKGIDKFESFLESNNLKVPEMIEFFRNIQALRSSTVAHRRSLKRKDTKKVLTYFKFDEKSIDEILEGIFENFIRTLNTIESYLIKST